MRLTAGILSALLLIMILILGVDKLSKDTVITPTDTITTSGGMLVKLGKVNAELAQTAITVGSAGTMIVGLIEAPAKIDKLFREAGGDTTTMLAGDITICLSSVVAYNSDLSGVVSAPIANQCRNFTKGQMVGTILTFAEDYTATVKTLYETQYTFINKGSK